MKKVLLVWMIGLVCSENAFAASKAATFFEGTSVRREAVELSLSAGLFATDAFYLYNAAPWVDEPLLDTHYQTFTGRETVPAKALMIAGPALASFIFLLPNRQGWLNPISYRHAKGFAEATMVFTPLMTDIAKLTAAKRRPDYPDRVALNKDLRYGRKSFWSKHAAVSFAFATYSNVYLYEYIADNAGKHVLWKIPVSIALYGGAGYVAWSRVHDHLHDAFDVTVGAVMGSALSLLIYGVHDNWFGSYYASNCAQSLDFGISPNGGYVAYRF